mgnify:CR=1 FL=1
MSYIIIKADAESNKILAELAKKLGGNVISVDDEKLEDIVFAEMMKEEKTGENIDRDVIMKKLNNNDSPILNVFC